MIVVADTSVILNLCCVGQQELLPRLYQEVVIPPEVQWEFERAARTYPRFAGLLLPPWVHTQPALQIPHSLRREPHLDPGEIAAIALALQLSAYAVLIDETEGRQAARRHGLVPIGVLGVLIRARLGGFLAAVRPVICELESKANFWVHAEVRSEALRAVGEAE